MHSAWPRVTRLCFASRASARYSLVPPSLVDLAGSVPVPAEKRGTPWPEVRRRTLLVPALEVYEVDRIDFAEAYLLANAEASGVETIASFDRSIDRGATVRPVEPSWAAGKSG